MPFQTSTNNYQISKYIVDATAADSPYNTIQAAMDAANTAGVPTTVFVRAGTFTENLTFYDGISLNGDNEQNTIIIGTHTPPATGTLNIFRCVFQSATDIFNSAVAGTTDIIMEDCGVVVTNGYTFNLLNWTGSIAVFDIGNGGTNDGFLNNTGGAPFYAFSTGFGNGVGNTMNVSGIYEITSSDCLCPIAFQGTAAGFITTSSFGSTITTANTAALDIYNSTLSTGALQALTHNSTTAMELADVTINTSNATAIGGTGTINFGSVTFLDSNVIAGTITQTLTSIHKTGEVHAENIQDQVFSGFLEFTGAGSIYTVVGTTFTLDRPGTGYIRGKKVYWLGGQNTGALAVSDTYWLYIDNTGTLVTATNRSNAIYEDNVALFLVLVDASSNVIVVGENHPYTFPVVSSNWAHDVVGTVIANQRGGANITLNGTKAIEIDGADELEDHGLETDIPDSGGVAETFNFMFTNGAGAWDRDSQANTFPSEYNNGGVVAALGASKYGVFRLFVSKDDIETATPVYYAIFDDAQYNNLVQAQTAVALNTPATSTNELFDLEMAQLGFVIKEESTDTIVDVIIEKSVAGTQTSMPVGNQASLVTTNTANFDGWLSATDTTVQAALETLDEVGKSPVVDPGAAGDSYIRFDINATPEFCFGVDDDDGDNLKITQGGATPSAGTEVWQLTPLGDRTMPLQPAFLGYMTAQDLNVTGNGTTYGIIGYDAEPFDQGGNFNAGTGTFAAPETGIYRFEANIVMIVPGTSTTGFLYFVTSNGTYVSNYVNPQAVAGGNTMTHQATLLGDMDAADTCVLNVMHDGAGADNDDIYGNGANRNSYFSGQLEV